MTTIPQPGDKPCRIRHVQVTARRRGVAILVASLIVAGASGGAALADDHGRDRGPPPRHDVRHDRRDYHPPVYGYDAPNYVPAPPPVVYGPPPLPPVLDFSLNIR